MGMDSTTISLGRAYHASEYYPERGAEEPSFEFRRRCAERRLRERREPELSRQVVAAMEGLDAELYAEDAADGVATLFHGMQDKPVRGEDAAHRQSRYEWLAVLVEWVDLGQASVKSLKRSIRRYEQETRGIFAVQRLARLEMIRQAAERHQALQKTA